MHTLARVVLLTNFIPPYRLPLYRTLAAHVGDLRVLLSTQMEANRQWSVDWSDLDVVVQRAVTLPHIWKHPQGFHEVQYVHFPYDTLQHLYHYRPSVIISGELGLRSLQALLYRTIQPKTRLVLWVTLSEHTEQNRGRIRDIARRMLFRNADAIIVTGHSGAKYVRRFNVPSQRIFPVQNPIDARPFYAMALNRTPHQAYRLLYVGRLSSIKGIELLFDALERLQQKSPERQPELWLAGTGPLEQHLRQRAVASALSVRFLGHVPYPLLPQVYAQAGILVFPSLGDNWGLVVNEAMASGMPVLGSRYSQAVSELVEDGIHGWTFHPDCPHEFDAALERALGTSLGQLEQMRSAVREQIRPVTPEAVVAGFLKAITYVMQTHPARP